MNASDAENLLLVRLARKLQSEQSSGPYEIRMQTLGRANVNMGTLGRGVREAIGPIVLASMFKGEVNIDAGWLMLLRVVDAYKRLDDEELDVVQFILRESARAYREGIEESALRASYHEATLDLDAVVARLLTKKVLVRSTGRVRLTI